MEVGILAFRSWAGEIRLVGAALGSSAVEVLDMIVVEEWDSFESEEGGSLGFLVVGDKISLGSQEGRWAVVDSSSVVLKLF